MATAKKLPSGNWRCQVYSHTEEIIQPDGTIKKKRIYKSFTCDDPSAKGRRKCEAEAAAWAAEKTMNSTSSITVRDAIERYIKSKENVLSPSTIRSYKALQKKHFSKLENIKLEDLTQETIQTWISTLSLTLSPKSVRNAHALLFSSVTMFFPSAHFGAVLPQKKKPELYIPTDADIKKLLDHVRGRELELAIYLAAFGPMRRGEICALTSDDVHGNIVSVNKSMVLTPDNTWEIKQPKTYASYREIEYPDFIGKMLRGKTGRIFSMTPSVLTNRFRTAVYYSGLPHFRFHDLRHYSASVMHAMNIPDVYIMQRGGWTTDNVMKTVYRHTLEDKESEMNKKANDYFNDLCNTKCNTKNKKP